MKIKISKAHINTILVISTIVLLSYLYITYQHELFKLTSIYEGMENEDDKNKKDKKDVKKPKIKLNTNGISRFVKTRTKKPSRLIWSNS